MLLASEVSEPGSSDPSSAGVCRGDSGTYTMSPSEWLPLPTLPFDYCLLEPKITQHGLCWIECGLMIKPQRGPIPPPPQYDRARRPGSSGRHRLMSSCSWARREIAFESAVVPIEAEALVLTNGSRYQKAKPRKPAALSFLTGAIHRESLPLVKGKQIPEKHSEIQLFPLKRN